MPNPMRFDLKGFDQVKHRLEAIGEEMATKAGQSAIREAAKTLAAEVKARVPYDEEDRRSPMSERYGHLRDNIRIRKGKPRRAHSVSALVTIGNAFWGRFLEFGTIKMLARPFFRPAFAASQDKITKELASNLGKALDRIAKRLGGKSR